MAEIAEAFKSGGLGGLGLLLSFLQLALFAYLLNKQQENHTKALNSRDALLQSMVEQLSVASQKQSDSNMTIAVVLSRIESRLGITE